MDTPMMLRRFSDLLHDLYRLQAPGDVVSRLTEHLPQLAPHDLAVPAITDRTSGAVTLEAGPPSYRESYARHAGEDASRLAHLEPSHPGAVRLSDLVPHRALAHAPIWTEVMRPHRIRHVMTTCLHEGARVVGVLKLVRSGHGRDFSVAERDFLDAVARHVRQAYANAEALTRLGADPDRLDEMVDRMPVAALVVGAGGAVEHRNRLADGALARCFGPAPRRGSAGAPLPSQLRALIASPAAETALTGHDGARFVARAARIDRGRGRPQYLLVLEDREGGRLSPREREVMRWVAEGKTNAEIGIILGISARTVQTHLDHSFAKLGVSRRAQAVAELARLGQACWNVKRWP
jgi:DNA-binding CsgD family transcriptional regulator